MGGRVIPARCAQRAGRRFVGRSPFMTLATRLRQLWLGFERPEPKRVPVLPLVGYEQEGGVSMTKGGAAHAIRLYVEALLAVPPELRRVGHGGPPASLYARLRNVVAGLWPRGWQCSRDWPRLLPASLNCAGSA